MRSRRLQGFRGYGSTIWYMDMTLNPDCMSVVPKALSKEGPVKSLVMQEPD